MCLWCWGVFRRCHVSSDGTGGVRWRRWIYVDVFKGAGSVVRVFGVCDIPVAYTKVVNYGDGSAGSSTQVCGASFWVSE